MKTDLLRGWFKFSRPLTKRDEQFKVIYVTQSKTALRNEKKYSLTAHAISIIPEFCLLTITVVFFSSGLFSLQRQAHEQEDRGLVNAAQSHNLLRLKEILDANPERVLFFLSFLLLLQIVFTSFKSFFKSRQYEKYEHKMRTVQLRF